MQKDHYLDKVYPLQDIILSLLNEKIYKDFYLTGGTALSRFYFQHRFSDGLDFFANQIDSFQEELKQFEEKIKSIGLNYKIISSSPSFKRLVIDKEAQLKIDFVNDVNFRYGGNHVFQNFNRVDNLRNILSNKLTALERLEPKDVADILFICRNLSFLWEDIFDDALKKVSFIDPIIISKYLTEFSIKSLLKLNWIINFNSEAAEKDIRTIGLDILKKNKNSLSS